MDRIKKIWHYLTHLEWTEKKQHNCTFCNRANLKSILYEVSVDRFKPKSYFDTWSLKSEHPL